MWFTMKNICTFLVTFFVLSISLFGWTKGSFIRSDFISNPYNDEEIVFTGTNSQSYELSACKFDINTGNSVFKEISLPNSSTIRDVIINGNSKRIGYLLNGKIVIFNYNDFSEIINFSLNYSGDSQDMKVCFSKDGSFVYTLKKSELRLTIYDVSSGLKQNEILINANPAFYSGVFLNSEKDEFALMINDSLEIWSISSGSMDRKIPFDSNAKLVQFRNSGNNISYKVGKVIHIVNSLTGDEIFNKTLSFNIQSMEFSANMKYMVCRGEYFDQSVWDIDSDTLIFDGSVPHQSGFDVDFVYINSNKTKTIGFSRELMYCGRYLDEPYQENVYFLYDMSDYRKINSASDGYVGNPVHAIINPANDLMLVSALYGEYNKPVYNHGLVTGTGEFLKFIHVQRNALAFSHDSKYIAFNDTTRLLLYNIESDIIEKTLQTQRSTLGTVFFSPQNGGLIISITKDFIDVYDYNSLTLNFTKDLTAESGNGYGFVCDITGKITILYPSGRYFKFDAGTGDLTEEILNNLPLNRTFRDMTNDGRYILWSIGKDSINVYDAKLQYVKFTYKIELISGYAENLAIGFLGNHEIVWISYITNPIDKYNAFYAYDLVKNDGITLDGEGTPRVSIDGTKYMTFYCPFTYSYNSIRLPVSVNEELSSGNSPMVYPNPTHDFITIQFQTSEVLETSEVYKIHIFDMLGIKKMSVGTGLDLSTQRIDVSHLPAGMYFIKIGDKVEKFVKY